MKVRKKKQNRILLVFLNYCRVYEISLPVPKSEQSINIIIDSVIAGISINCSAYAQYNTILEVIEEQLSIPKSSILLIGSIEYHSFDGEYRLCDLGIQNGAILVLNVIFQVTIDDTPTVIRSSRCSTGCHLYYQIVSFERDSFIPRVSSFRTKHLLSI